MSIRACLPGLVEQGKVDPDTAERMGLLFDDLERVYRRQFGDQTAAAMASREVIERMERETFQRRRRKVLQAAAEKDAEKWLRGGGEHWGNGGRTPRGAVPGAGEPGPINPKAARTLLARVDARRKAIEARAFAFMDGILARHRRDLVGRVRHKAELDEIGRAAFGEKADNLNAREFAEAWLQAAEMLRMRANAAGANIGKLERWGLPQSHDSRAVSNAGLERWRDDILPLLAPDRMLDEDTGFPFTPAKLELALREVWQTIASDGRNKLTPGQLAPSGMRAGALDEHRFLKFRDYDAWAAYSERYGAGTAYDAMMGHIQGMARHVAALEMLGPNPEATIRYVRDVMTGDAALTGPGQLRARDKAESEANIAERMWAEYTGALRRPDRRIIQQAFSTYRAVATASKLGTSFITAQSDHGFDLAVRRFNGLPQARMLAGYLKMFNPHNLEDRRLATRIGFTADSWTSTTAAQLRQLGEEIVGERSRRLAEGVIRASGLAAHTDAKRMVFWQDLLAHVTSNHNVTWGKLDEPFRALLERYGIGRDGWDALRTTPLEEDGGAWWIKPQNIKDRELGDRLLEMGHTEVDLAVPIAGLEARSYLNANVRHGTALGEVIRSGPLKFKNFTVSVMVQHGSRMMHQGGLSGKAGYLIGALIPLTIFGAVSAQMYEIANGRDPRLMDPSSDEGQKFWGNALIRSGGLSILGDLLGVSANDRQSMWIDFYGGPLGGDFYRLADAGGGLITGDDRAPYKLVDWAGRQVPGNNLWYARLAIDRLLADMIQQEIDPDYADGFRRMEKYADEAGTQYWWAPGTDAPQRGPDFGNALPEGDRSTP